MADETVLVGGVVAETHVQAPAFAESGKQLAEFAGELGGSPANLARQFQWLGECVRPIIWVGDDALGETVRKQAAEDFDNSMALAAFATTRQALILGAATYTNRPPIVMDCLPDSALSAVREAKRLVIGPDHPQNLDFLKLHLQLNSQTVLQLSKVQLSDIASQRLARMASCVAVNDEELGLWTGRSELPLKQQMEMVRDAGVKDLIVTHAGGVEAWVDDRFYEQAGFQVQRLARTSAAGDTFLSTYLSHLDQYGPQESLRRGQAAAALFVEGNLGYRSREFIERTSRQRPHSQPANKTRALARALRFVTGMFFA